MEYLQQLDKSIVIAGIMPPVISTKKKPGWVKAYMSHVGFHQPAKD